MSLAATFAAIRPAVVAFMIPFAPAQPDGRRPPIFPIVGTGFILDDGFVITNAHVIDALLSIPRPPTFPKDRWPFTAVLFHHIDRREFPKAPTDGYAEIPLEVLGVFRVGDLVIGGKGFYYGPRKPDFNIVHVKAKGLPRVELLTDTDVLAEGTEVGTVGFPMGTEALTAPGWAHQFGPFLQRGVISAVLPFPCKSPHSFVINVMSMGGASGSPVFLAEKPKVIGILNAGLTGTLPTVGAADGKITGIVQAHTNFSYVVPSWFLGGSLERIKADGAFKLPDDTLTLGEMIERASLVVRKEPGHNEPPDPGRVFVEPEGAPKIEVRIEPTARE